MAKAVASFCARHFSWRGAWSLNQQALGLDLLRAPLNVFYAPLWVLLQISAQLLAWLGLQRAARIVRELPSGLATQVQQRVRQAITDELIRPRWGSTLDTSQQRIVALNLMRYQAARNAMADISANLAVLVSGMLLFRQFTPGGLSLGQHTGDALTQHWAISHFWAGESFGRLWYSWFPVDTPLWLSLTAIALVMVMIALTAALSGLLMDPVQHALGWHRRRLNRLLNAIDKDLQTQQAQHYQPREPFWARAFDALDWLRL